ncbi:hypothetical protein [Tautonia plasticadhaerens]|uniref:Uncharacterized protein n=1 Tax=Tautonia plasticadhaerens TaxID=2527974 RepID=A0A518HB90_9BACT|nr:hypothetical protein [Tautonia plasticadhaerens]QDV38128.1 hypothetical protein ElP_60770 [Tautonia plasticadhaerens]
MTIPRFSLGGLMAVVALAAVFFVAVRDPSDWWSSVAFTGAVAFLGVASLHVAYLRGRARVFWAGASSFGWGYLAMAFAPGLESSIRPRLAPTLVLETMSLIALGSTSKVRAESFEDAGHSLVAVLVALLGGLIASRIALRSERARPEGSTGEGTSVAR